MEQDDWPKKLSSSAAEATTATVPPTMTLLRRAWDVDRFIVLGSLEKVVAVMFCSSFEKFKHGIRHPAGAASHASGATMLASNNNSKNKDAERTNFQYMREAALMHSTLQTVSIPVSRFCTIYLADTSMIRDFDVMYELHADEPFALLFFYRNKHVLVDVGTGNHNKINFAIENTDEMIAILDAVYVQSKKGLPVVKTGLTYSDYAERGMN